MIGFFSGLLGSVSSSATLFVVVDFFVSDFLESCSLVIGFSLRYGRNARPRVCLPLTVEPRDVKVTSSGLREPDFEAGRRTILTDPVTIHR